MSGEFFDTIVLLASHWLVDFVFQSDKTAINKSKSFKYLFGHCAAYGILMTGMAGSVFCRLIAYRIDNAAFYFVILLAIAVILSLTHIIIDGITSKMTSAFWAENNCHAFFITIGMDQMFHYIVLFGLYVFMKNLT